MVRMRWPAIIIMTGHICTGDIFSAVLIGHLLNGESLKVSTRTAMDTVFRMIDRYRNVDDRNKGIPVEKCLDLL